MTTPQHLICLEPISWLLVMLTLQQNHGPNFSKFMMNETRKIMASKTPAERQTCLNHEKKPPIKKVNVFLWDWSDEDPLQLVRTMVTRHEAEDIVSSYSDLHSVYNSYSNVWDTCKYFGEQSNNDDNIGNDDSVVLTPSGTPADNNGTLEQAEHEAFLRD